MMKDVKFSCNYMFFLFKNHADTSLIEFRHRTLWKNEETYNFAQI